MIKKITVALAFGALLCINSVQATPLDDAILAYQNSQIRYHSLGNYSVMPDVDFAGLELGADEIRRLILSGENVDETTVQQAEAFDLRLQDMLREHGWERFDDTNPRNVIYPIAPRLRAWSQEAQQQAEVIAARAMRYTLTSILPQIILLAAVSVNHQTLYWQNK